MSDQLKHLEDKIRLAGTAIEKIDLKNEFSWEFKNSDPARSLETGIVGC